MGAYLSSPVTEKVSSDKELDNFSYGASSMQGWRKSQEDAHNCCPDFDPERNTSVFAVYDGHGGAEVAQYCALYLPEFLKSTEAYKKNELSQALEEAFLGFDATLITDDVIKTLKTLADLDDEGDAEEEEEETNLLNEEATMPLEEVLAKYGGVQTLSPGVQEIYNRKGKFQSPALKPRKNVDNVDSTQSEDDVKMSLESNLINGHSENENNANLERERSRNVESTTENGEVQSSSSNFVSQYNDNKVSDSTVGSSDDASSNHQCESACSGAVESKIDRGDVENISSGSGDCTSCVGSSSSVTTVDADGGPAGSLSGSSGGLDGGGEPGVSSSGASGSKEENPEPCSSSGKTRKPRKNIIPEEDESETSFDSDEEDTEEEEADSDEFCEEDSEDEDDEEGEDDEGEDEVDLDDGVEEECMATMEEDRVRFTPGADSGCTAVVALLRDRELYVANAGDSRCVVCRAGKAVDMSFDHKPEYETEKTRIQNAGGMISWDGRVNGGLNLSRAIGDHCYKKNKNLDLKDQMISALPDVNKLSLGDEDEFMVLACDGIWNFMSSQEVVDFVSERIGQCEKISSICEQLFDHCLSPDTSGDGTGCDNMTCIIIKFKNHNSSKSREKRAACDEDCPGDGPSKKCKVDEDISSEAT